MNHSGVLKSPMRKLVIVTFMLFVAGAFAILITAGWQLLQFPSGQAPSKTDMWDVVDDLHAAINSNNVDQVLVLFAHGATITDNRTVISDRDQIRDWVLHSKQMAGLHLKMFHSEMDGEKLIWLDTAYNGVEGQSRWYILRWEAVIEEGKIRSLVVMPRYIPDLK